ncbi:MAG: DsbE family thiol:disulfide interchange protein [Pseudomonadales bacterium]|jgi:cytochrome c biogenesis protein CcmG/thiol:disulfide interchange protein DsbE
MSRASLFVPLGLFLLIVVVGYVGFSLNDPHKLPSALIGKPFPEFSAPRLGATDEQVGRADLLGEPVLVNVWATWCPTCMAEHGELLRIGAETGIRIVGVNYKDDPAKALDWLIRFGDPYDFVIEDRDGSLGVELGVYGAPETFLLDAAGIVVHKHVGDINSRVWRDAFAPLVAALAAGDAK